MQKEITLSGYVNVAERESRTLHDKDGSFIEIVSSGAFDKALQTNPKPEIRLNHERVLEVTNLTAFEDNIGLKVEFTTSDEEVRSLYEHGRLKGWSFAFTANDDSYEIRDGVRYRRLNSFDLHEISVLSVLPAYIAMSVESRNAETKEVRSTECEFEVELRSEEQQEDVLGKLNTQRKRFEFELLRGK